mgnify:CR=1 FL=1
MIVYGRLPLMHSASVYERILSAAMDRRRRLVLKDRYDKEFPVVCYCRPWKMGNTKAAESCYNIIYNSLPYGLLKEADRVKELGVSSVRLAFTIESRKKQNGSWKTLWLHIMAARYLTNMSLQKVILKEEPSKGV